VHPTPRVSRRIKPASHIHHQIFPQAEGADYADNRSACQSQFFNQDMHRILFEPVCAAQSRAGIRENSRRFGRLRLCNKPAKH
jgi:hypothetical protein